MNDLQEQISHALHHRVVPLARKGGDAQQMNNIPCFNIDNGSPQVGTAEITTDISFHGQSKKRE